MSEPMESTEGTDAVSGPGMVSRRRALGLGAAVAGGVWVAPAILSFDAASAAPSGTGPTTSTTAPEPTTTTTEVPPTTTTTAAPRTITASVTGSLFGVTNPEPVTVPVGEPINLVFTRTTSGTLYIGYSTVNGTATAGVDYTAKASVVMMTPSESTKTVTIQTTATGAGPNTAFSLQIEEPF
jgi:hypothetical protein